jgi:4-amino-4-deoxy-L-arabinose transferase-like glycosyltransferase
MSPSFFSPSSTSRAWFKNWIRKPLLIFLVAAGVRFGVVGVLLENKQPSWNVNEAAGIARQLAAGHGFSSPYHDASGPTAWVAPVYPSLLAGMFRLFATETPASAWAAVSLNILFGSLTALVILEAGKYFFGELAGLFAAWAWAISPPTVVMPWFVWETCLSALVMTWLLLYTLRLKEPSPTRAWIFCGAMWGAAAMVNPSLLAPLPFLVVLIAWRRASWKRAAMLAGACILCMTPWTVRNYVALGSLIPVRSNFWPEAFFGNVSFEFHPSGNSMLYQREGEVAFARDLHARLVEHLEAHPVEFWAKSVDRLGDFWTQPQQFSPFPFLLLMTALGGLLLARRAGLEWEPFFYVLLVYPLPYYFTYTFSRYRHPIEPLLYLLAGYAISTLMTQRLTSSLTAAK